MRSALRGRPGRLHLVLMLALTFSTGIVDAVGYLGLDRVFTGNMTGNVVILGMALLGADELPVIGPLIALVGFVLGAMVAGRVLRPVDVGWERRSTVLFAVIGVVILGLAIVLLVAESHLSDTARLTVTPILGFAMGMQAATARHLAVKDVTTVVVTSTLTGLASDSVLGGRKEQKWKRRLAAVALIGLGAVLGAAAVQVNMGLGLLVSAIITLAASWLGHMGRPAPSAEAAAEG